ncbi:MAG: flavin reductase family protein [Dehalococcoidia bacterium]|tara:strand:- start:137 stop:676 length:540 start_codon:yes stop_codon:yes gene_type:complete
MFENEKNIPQKHKISDVMDLFTYGIYAIGSVRDEQPNFMIADWVLQISFNPRLVLVSFEKDSYSRESILQNKIFNINILSKQNIDTARKFLQPKRSSKIKGRSDDSQNIIIDKLEGIDYSKDNYGLPILNDCVAFIHCAVTNNYEVGDHTLVVAEVIEGSILNYEDPMSSIDTGWHYSG